MPQDQRAPMHTRERTVFPCGLVRAAHAEPAQRHHIKAPGEEVTTNQIAESEAEPVRMHGVRLRLILNDCDKSNSAILMTLAAI